MNKNKSKYFNTALFMNEALLSLLEKKDFEYITVKELCNKAGVNRSTFYLHYETMNDLLNETINMIEKKFYSSFNKDLKIDDLIKKDAKDADIRRARWVMYVVALAAVMLVLLFLYLLTYMRKRRLQTYMQLTLLLWPLSSAPTYQHLHNFHP